MRLVAVWTLALANSAYAATVDGAKIYWKSTGNGRQDVILVHGWTCDDSSWAEQVPVLWRTYRVVTLDLPGHGQSGMPNGTWSMELFARAVEAVRAEAKIDKAVLVGHSMGTPVIRKYALMYPEHVSGLVLVDGLVQIPNPSAAAGPPRAGGPGPMTGPDGLKAREAMIRGMFGPLTTPPLQQHIMKMMMGAPEATAAGAMAATQDRTQWSDKPITVPVLAVYAGTRPLASETAVKTLYPSAEYHQIPETAHFLMMERPTEFNRLLVAFLESVR